MRGLLIPSLFLTGICWEQLAMKGSGDYFRFWGNNDNYSSNQDTLLDWSLGTWRASSWRYRVFLRFSSHSFLPTGYKVFLAAESLGYSFLRTPKHADRGKKRKRPPCGFTGPQQRRHSRSRPEHGISPLYPPTFSCSVLLRKAVIILLQCRAGITPSMYHCTRFWAVQVFGGKIGKS